MANRPEHDIKRTIWHSSNPRTIQQDSKSIALVFGDTLISASELTDYINSFDNSILEDIPEYWDYNNKLNIVTETIKTLLNHFESAYKEEAFHQKYQRSLESEKLSKKLEKLQDGIKKFLEHSKDDTSLKELTTKEFFDFITYYFDVKFTDKDSLIKEYGDIINELSVDDNFKGITYTSRGDGKLIFLIAIVILTESTSSILPFSLFEKDFYEKALININPEDSKGEKLRTVKSNLKNLSLKSLPITKETRYAFLFYASITAIHDNPSKKLYNLSNKYNAIKNILKSFSFIFEEESSNLINELCEHPEDLYALLPSGISSGESLTSYRGEFEKNFEELKNLKETLLQKYVRLVPDILTQIEFDDAAREAYDYEIELIDECREITSLVYEENKAIFLSVLKKYNFPYVDDNVLLILFNLSLLDDSIGEHLIHVCLSDENCCSEFSFPDFSENTLKDLLKQKCINDEYIKLLTQLDFHSFTVLELNFTLSLPELYKSKRSLMSAFLNLLIELNGKKAFTNLKDIFSYLMQ